MKLRRVSAIVLVALLAACGTGRSITSPSTSPTAATTQDLPPEVAEKRDAIVRAARAFDYDALHGLLDEETFSYSFGEDGDPIGYWRRQEEDAHVPVLGDILPSVLAMPHGRREEIVVWPRVFTLEPAEWTDADRGALRTVYSDEDIAAFEEAGAYTGWRVGIREDGTWLYFVAGD